MSRHTNKPEFVTLGSGNKKRRRVRGRSGASFNLSPRFLLLCTAATLAWHWNGNERAISFRYFSAVPRFLSATSSSFPSSFPSHLDTYQRAPLNETLESIASKD